MSWSIGLAAHMQPDICVVSVLGNQGLPIASRNQKRTCVHIVCLHMHPEVELPLMITGI